MRALLLSVLLISAAPLSAQDALEVGRRAAALVEAKTGGETFRGAAAFVSSSVRVGAREVLVKTWVVVVGS